MTRSSVRPAREGGAVSECGGRAAFLVLNGQPILLSASMTSPLLSQYIGQINQIMADDGTTDTVSAVSLAGYKTYAISVAVANARAASLPPTPTPQRSRAP